MNKVVFEDLIYGWFNLIALLIVVGLALCPIWIAELTGNPDWVYGLVLSFNGVALWLGGNFKKHLKGK